MTVESPALNPYQLSHKAQETSQTQRQKELVDGEECCESCLPDTTWLTHRDWGDPHKNYTDQVSQRDSMVGRVLPLVEKILAMDGF